MDKKQIAHSFEFDTSEVAELRRRWLRLLDTVVWDELSTTKLGALPRLRKRMLELGESMRSLVNDRRWIPQPREQVKSAMAACLAIRDSLLQVERAAKLVSGGADAVRFEAELIEFRRLLLVMLERHETDWCSLLESQYEGYDDAK